MNWKRFFATAMLVLTAGLGQHEASASKTAPAIAPVKDQRALKELKAMSDALAGAKSMAFKTDSMTPIRGANKQWIHVFATAKVSMQRPHQVFIETGGDAFPQRLYYDGKMFSVSAAEKNMYTQMEMTGSIDSMLAQAAAKAGDAFPFADVLVTDPLASWTKDLDGAMYVGVSERGNEKLAHLALTAKDVDWEVWVDQKTHLPRMVYVKYTGEERSPSVLIEFSKWKLNSKIPDSVFAFKAAAGAKKTDLKAPERTSK